MLLFQEWFKHFKVVNRDVLLLWDIIRQLTSLLSGFWLFAEHPFLGGTHGFVGTMDTANPAAGAAFAFQQLFGCSFDAASPCLDLLGVFYPADKFIASQRRDIFP